MTWDPYVQFSRGNEKTFEDSWNVKVADDGSEPKMFIL